MKQAQCVWCGRDLNVFPDVATNPYVVMCDTYICFSCVKHLAMILKDQETRRCTRVSEPMFVMVVEDKEIHYPEGNKCIGVAWDVVTVSFKTLKKEVSPSHRYRTGRPYILLASIDEKKEGLKALNRIPSIMFLEDAKEYHIELQRAITYLSTVDFGDKSAFLHWEDRDDSVLF